VIEVSDEWLELMKVIERLTRRASTCTRILLCFRRRARAGTNVRPATANMMWQLRRLNIEIDRRHALLFAAAEDTPEGDAPSGERARSGRWRHG
jgi:hypothetical protein